VESTAVAARIKPDVDMMKALREQLDHTVSDLRLEAKRGMDVLGREMESTVSELRGTISALSLQIECGVSGSTSALADAVGTAAQKHVDYLEWLRTLDSHRSQIERQQAELEERLSAMLGAQKMSLEADIEAVNLRTSQQHTRIADLDNSSTHANSRLENLRASVSALDTQLRARVIEWDGFSESIRDRVGSLQAGIAENKWGMVTIAGAISTIAKPDVTSPSRHSLDGDSQYLTANK